MKNKTPHIIALLAAGVSLFLLKACLSGNDSSDNGTASTMEEAATFEGFPDVASEKVQKVTDKTIGNPEAPVPPQCYTRTEQEHNPCFTCHQLYPRGENDPYRMNKLDDGSLQGGYLFSDIGVKNHWHNLFEDRTDWVAAISDKAILRYINQENYTGLAGNLAERGWEGFVPDLANYHLGAEAFAEFGVARDGSGWVAFNYKPFPSTFWPTNGSTDDVLIRLDKKFRTLNGDLSTRTYLLNLSLLEMTIKDLQSIDIPAVDESAYAVDINGDGQIAGIVRKLARRDYYLGDARDVAVLPQQYPLGTEFMHSVRYVGVDNDKIVVPPRMKELRYMRKIRELTDHQLDNRYWQERKDKFEGLLPSFPFHHDKGFENGYGWMVQGFIEGGDGELRPQSFEEGMFCMGCHAAIGTTIDHTFSFGRKVTGVQGWRYINLEGMADAPSKGGDEPEILAYLERVNGGNEFRENPEMQTRWFNADGSVREQAVRQADVYTLITPSPERALKLNKAYTHIVRHQDFIHGRDATVKPVKNVFDNIDESEPPLSSERQFYGWDLRLQWNSNE